MHSVMLSLKHSVIVEKKNSEYAQGTPQARITSQPMAPLNN